MAAKGVVKQAADYVAANAGSKAPSPPASTLKAQQYNKLANPNLQPDEFRKFLVEFDDLDEIIRLLILILDFFLGLLRLVLPDPLI
jgi:hypothetical protein